MGEIVVGVDGSPSSRQALEWAAAEAERRGKELLVLQSWREPALGSTGATGGYEADLVFDGAKAALDSVATEVHETHPRVPVTSVLVDRRPATALVERADDGDLLVVGNRGGGGFLGLELGSVSTKVARRSPVPVVVVRGNVDRVDRDEVVVGIDGSECSRQALRWAADWAKAHDKTLVILMAWNHLEPQGLHGPEKLDVEYEAADADRTLDAIVADVLGPRPNPRIVTETACELPARAVLERAAEACLVVLGRHGTPRWSPPSIGATAIQVLHHAPCPVAVIPEVEARADLAASG
jgi:nucleotide-binding universal stress UspA family protein